MTVNLYHVRQLATALLEELTMLSRTAMCDICFLLQHSQLTAASIKRDFSMLEKLLAKDRKFKVNKVKQHMILHFNSCTCLLQSWLLFVKRAYCKCC